MESILTQAEGYVFLALFWLVVFFGIRYFFRNKTTSNEFLVSNRSVGIILGAITVAVSWVWAPAFFVSSQKAFEQGLPGLFWFTLPNAGAVLVLAFLVGRMRKVFDHGYTLPEYMRNRYNRRMEILYSAVILIAQTYALILNLTAALLMLNLVTGISKQELIVVLGAIMLSLSVIKGIRSSLVQDTVKAVMITVVGVLIVPWTINSGGGINSVMQGLGGSSGNFNTIFDPTVAWTFGIPFSISLLSAIVLDQQQWQRAFSMKNSTAQKSFIYGGLLFAAVPVILGLLGFVAVSAGTTVPPNQTQLVGFYTVLNLLPHGAIIIFTAMVLAGLIATGSAALNAISSVGAKNVYVLIKPKASDREIIKASRISMLILVLVAMGVSLIPNIQLLYLVLLVGTFRASLFVPTILSLYSSKLSERFAFTAIIAGMVTGVPLFVYGSIVKNATISSFGSLVPIILTLLICLTGIALSKSKFKFNKLNLALNKAPSASPQRRKKIRK